MIENPVTGGRILFRKTAEDTSGEALQFDVFLRPHGFDLFEHAHPRQEERGNVVRGTVMARIGADERAFEPGDVIVVPPGTPHRFWNGTEDEAQLFVELRPALRTETMLETLFGLARDGKTNQSGIPNPLQLAVLAREHADEVYLARPLWPLQRAIVGGLAKVGGRLGYRPRYPEYSGDGAGDDEASR